MVHASLNAVGNFERRAEIVTDALLTLLGPGGTLAMPALSYETVTPESPHFSVSKTPSCVGGLTEYFRRRSDTRRSIHPTHSVSARGFEADYLLGDHQLDHTPCGPHSPFHKLLDLEGKILFLGCGLGVNTSMHAIEELSLPPYLFGPEVTYIIQPENGPAYRKRYITHDFSHTVQRYERVLPLLRPEDYAHGHVLEAESYLLHCAPLWEKAHARLLEDPLYFVDRE